jgi:multidrug efflux pump subunit AcrB
MVAIPGQNTSAQVNVVTQGGAAVPQLPGQSTASPPGLASTGQATVTPSTVASTGQATAGSATNSSQAAPSSTTTSGPTTPELLSNVATVGRDTTPQIVNSYNTLPVFDVYASVENRDLGGVTSDVEGLVKEFQKKAPTGTILKINGQALTMQTSFVQLGLGLVFAIVLIYLLLTVNFESWIDPLIIVMASPGALCGVLWGLFATKSTFNVPSLMGAIMSVGVATANSILLVTFANDRRHAGKNALEAALDAGYTRFRPVAMTALAMILGMLPMAIGMGDGGEQNAPLGRAVIGGLLVATCTTLIFVPLMYTVFRHAEPDPNHVNAGNALNSPVTGHNFTADKPNLVKE